MELLHAGYTPNLSLTLEDINRLVEADNRLLRHVPSQFVDTLRCPGPAEHHPCPYGAHISPSTTIFPFHKESALSKRCQICRLYRQLRTSCPDEFLIPPDFLEALRITRIHRSEHNLNIVHSIDDSDLLLPAIHEVRQLYLAVTQSLPANIFVLDVEGDELIEGSGLRTIGICNTKGHQPHQVVTQHLSVSGEPLPWHRPLVSTEKRLRHVTPVTLATLLQDCGVNATSWIIIWSANITDVEQIRKYLDADSSVPTNSSSIIPTNARIIRLNRIFGWLFPGSLTRLKYVYSRAFPNHRWRNLTYDADIDAKKTARLLQRVFQ